MRSILAGRISAFRLTLIDLYRRRALDDFDKLQDGFLGRWPVIV